MSELEINQVLATMRALAADAASKPAHEVAPKADFGALLKESIDKVNSTQKAASAASDRFERGDPDTDLTEVMLALQKADVSFKAMTEVRNKLVEAYREIMNMPI